MIRRLGQYLMVAALSCSTLAIAAPKQAKPLPGDSVYQLELPLTTVFAGPLYDYVDRAASGLRGGAYIEAVLAGVVQ